MTTEQIFNKLPFAKPFLFVDKLHYVNENEASGSFTFDENLDFYKGHFKNYPITPGVILIEVMAQIGVSTIAIFLKKGEIKENELHYATHAEVEFLKPVLPKETVTVFSKKIYARFGKVKCKVIMKNELGEIVCQGILAGLLKQHK